MKNVAPRVWGYGRRLWRWGEGDPCVAGPGAQAPMAWIWQAWLSQLGRPEAALWSGACMVGPAHSGRHRLARRLASQVLAASGHVAWLGPAPPWGLPQGDGRGASGMLLFGAAAEMPQAVWMARTLLQSAGLHLVVWVLPPCHASAQDRLNGGWDILCRTARLQGARLLALAPASPVHLTQLGPAWFLRERP